MCLAIPGHIEALDDESRQAKVRFGEILREVDLSLVPEAAVGEYVLVHAGFALQKLDQEEAERVFEYLSEIEALEDEISG